MNVQHTLELGLRLQRIEPALLRAETGVELAQLRRHIGPVRRRLAEPALAVAADPGRVRERAQPPDRLERPGRPRREVAAEQVRVGTCGVRVFQHLIEGDHVAVDVVQDSQHASLGSHR